jgi:hypothetical protein
MQPCRIILCMFCIVLGSPLLRKFPFLMEPEDYCHCHRYQFTAHFPIIILIHAYPNWSIHNFGCIAAWMWRQSVPLKHRMTFIELHIVISQKTELFIVKSWPSGSSWTTSEAVIGNGHSLHRNLVTRGWAPQNWVTCMLAVWGNWVS